jgi:hypothetical protein
MQVRAQIDHGSNLCRANSARHERHDKIGDQNAIATFGPVDCEWENVGQIRDSETSNAHAKETVNVLIDRIAR